MTEKKNTLKSQGLDLDRKIREMNDKMKDINYRIKEQYDYKMIEDNRHLVQLKDLAYKEQKQWKQIYGVLIGVILLYWYGLY